MYEPYLRIETHSMFGLPLTNNHTSNIIELKYEDRFHYKQFLKDCLVLLKQLTLVVIVDIGYLNHPNLVLELTFQNLRYER